MFVVFIKDLCDFIFKIVKRYGSKKKEEETRCKKKKKKKKIQTNGYSLWLLFLILYWYFFLSSSVKYTESQNVFLLDHLITHSHFLSLALYPVSFFLSFFLLEYLINSIYLFLYPIYIYLSILFSHFLFLFFFYFEYIGFINKSFSFFFY